MKKYTQQLMKNKYYHSTIRKKPVYYTMQKWRGDNIDEILDFLGNSGKYYNNQLLLECQVGDEPNLYSTIEVYPGSYIVKDKEGDFHVYSENAFSNKYDIVIKQKNEITGEEYYEALPVLGGSNEK